MDIKIFERRLLEKGLIDFFPHTAMYAGGYVSGDSLSRYGLIPLVDELVKMALAKGYEVRLEIYPHHKVCDVVIENNNDCFYKSNVVVSYSLINEKIIGCDISDSMEGSIFTGFIRELVSKYIEPIKGEIEKW